MFPSLEIISRATKCDKMYIFKKTCISDNEFMNVNRKTEKEKI